MPSPVALVELDAARMSADPDRIHSACSSLLESGTPSVSISALILCAQAEGLFSSDPDRALVLLDTAVTKDPDCTDAHILRMALLMTDLPASTLASGVPVRETPPPATPHPNMALLTALTPAPDMSSYPYRTWLYSISRVWLSLYTGNAIHAYSAVSALTPVLGALLADKDHVAGSVYRMAAVTHGHTLLRLRTGPLPCTLCPKAEVWVPVTHTPGPPRPDTVVDPEPVIDTTLGLGLCVAETLVCATLRCGTASFLAGDPSELVHQLRSALHSLHRHLWTPSVAAAALRAALFTRFAALLLFSVPQQCYPVEEFLSPVHEAVKLLVLAARALPLIQAPKSSAARSLVRLQVIGLGRAGAYEALADTLRTAVAQDVASPGAWLALAQCLSAARTPDEALLAVRHALHISPESLAGLLLGARLCLNSLSDAARALEYGRRAASLCSTHAPALRGSCHLAHGVAAAKHAYEVPEYAARKLLQVEALEALGRAVTQSSGSPRALFHLALVQADIRDIPASLANVNESLRRDPGYAPAWQLLALLRTSAKEYPRAVRVCDAGLAECGGTDALLLFTKARVHLEWMRTQDDQGVRDTARAALQCFSVLVAQELPDCSLVWAEARGLSYFYFGNSVPATPRAVDAPAQSVLSLKYGDADAFKYQLLLSLAKMYGNLYHLLPGDGAPDLLKAAYTCLDLARDLGSVAWLPDIYFRLAVLCLDAGDEDSARLHFDNALAFDSNHVPTLVRLGGLERKAGRDMVAHEYLSSVLRSDATSYDAWRELGLVYQAQGNHEQACVHLLEALELDRTAPALNFFSIPRDL